MLTDEHCKSEAHIELQPGKNEQLSKVHSINIFARVDEESGKTEISVKYTYLQEVITVVCGRLLGYGLLQVWDSGLGLC